MVVFSQDYYSQGLVYDNMVYYPSIKSVQCYPEGAEIQLPIIELNSGKRLILAFDDLESGVKSFQYTFIHCDFNWNPTNMLQMDFIQGGIEDNIVDWSASFNTQPIYTHFKLSFPNNNLKITKSGNYILKVYQNNDPESLILTRKFMVFEKRVAVGGRVQAASIIADRDYKQEVDFTVSGGEYPLPDAYTNVMVSVIQNLRIDKAVNNLKPLHVNGNTLTYDFDNDNVFNGLSEWRELDIKNLQLTSLRVSNIRRDDDKNWQVFMINDESKAFKRYTTFRDINGSFVIRNSIGNGDTDGDYAFVNFTLEAERPFPGEVYIIGQFNDFKCLPENKMKYFPEYKNYGGSVFLKQGYYNYYYTTLKPGESIGDETSIEGNRFETENRYTILVYQRGIGYFYDKLIGYTEIGSNTFGR